jgi:hypothetical protein
LQFGTTEVLDDILPIRGVIEPAQVGLQLATENLQSGTLADTVGSNQSKHHSGTGHGQSVELEAVGRVSMGDLALEVRGQVDDGNGAERTFLGANTASNAETLRDEGQTGLRCHFDTELAASYDGAGFLAFLTTFLDLVSLHRSA